MEIQRKCLDTIFRRLSAETLFQSILDEKHYLKGSNDFAYDNISFSVFQKGAQKVFFNYSEDEIHNIYESLKTELKLFGIENKKSVFNLLPHYTEQVLTTDDKFPICKYNEVLNWRELSNKLGQDLLTTSYLAYRDLKHKESTYVFSWRPVIKTDNHRLHKILDQGMAENHYHLGGSTQIFPLSWISAMNHYEVIQKMSSSFEEVLDSDVLNEAEPSNHYWSVQLKRAAIIRAYLFGVINNMHDLARADILTILEDPLFSDVSNHISALRFSCGYKTAENGYILDYCLKSSLDENNFNTNRSLAGERYFLYHCFRKIYAGEFSVTQNNLFYLYLLIKAKFRSELVQVNDHVGFKNFSNYQNRKGYFVDGLDCYEEEVYNLALNATLEDQSIRSLEARIMVKNSAKQLKKSIKNIEDSQHKTAISSNLSTSTFDTADALLMDSYVKSEDDRYFYVLHFPKKAFRLDKDKTIEKFRNYDIRTDNKKRAKAIGQALADDYNLRKRIKGIDGCSNEIGCRPEVLANEIRYLSNYNPISSYSYFKDDKVGMNLRITYHAGEDFLDLVDGLRAIDETILFLNLKRDDRLGHALALGINVSDYYKIKHYKVILTKQDLLDNVVWIIYKSQELNITLEPNLCSNLCSVFEELANEIYGSFAKKEGIQLTTYTYWNSWKLRGDHPELYRGGKYEKTDFFDFDYTVYCSNPMISDTIRQNKDAALLYYAYHYDYKVKQEGLEKYIYKVETTFIKTVAEIQHKMQFEIEKQGIAIECNPTSNYLIGTFKRFDKHPILQFHNSLLEYEPEKLHNSPQLCVSINTDDQGVFDTYLENEYAVMASALEKMEDEDGNKKYSSDQIYKWIDDIRKMGFEQSFQ